MTRVIHWNEKAWESTPLTMLARIQNAGANITQAGIASISYAVKNAAGTATSSGTLTVASVVYDTLQTGARWTKDNTGYNFLGTLPAACFPAAGLHYAELKFTDASGNIFWIVVDVTVCALHSI